MQQMQQMHTPNIYHAHGGEILERCNESGDGDQLLIFISESESLIWIYYYCFVAADYRENFLEWNICFCYKHMF